jgi:S1-C subfamily serine protease
VIVRVGSATIAGGADVSEVVFTARPGQRVRVEYRRAGRRRAANVRLARRPSQAPPGTPG